MVLVEIIDYRGNNKSQLNLKIECYQKNFLKYNLLLFYDIDKIIYLKERNIKYFIVKKKINSCDSIYLNWVNHLDNSLIRYKNGSLLKGFKNLNIIGMKIMHLLNQW